MFNGIVAERAACDHCGKLRQVAHIPRAGDDAPYQVAYEDRMLRLCAGCIARLQGLAYFLRRLEAEPPKKPRKRARGQPSHDAPYSGPSKHEVGSLVPVDGDRSP